MNALNLKNVALPIVAAPMFLISGPDLVIAGSKAGIPTLFPTANARTSEILEHWLKEISAQISIVEDAPWGVNLNTHRLNPRLEADLALTVNYRAPLVVTALGAPAAIVEAVHSYGGLVLADVTSVYHAKKAVSSGVDALVLVCGGAGGHTGQLSPFAFVNEVRQFWSGAILLAGAVTTGNDVAKALALGADYAYMGTRFIATQESMAKNTYRRMIEASNADDIVCTNGFTGIPNNMLRPSIRAAGIDPDNIPITELTGINFKDPHEGAKAWRDIWSAGQGVGSIKSSPSVLDVVSELEREFTQALNNLSAKLQGLKDQFSK